MLCIMPPKVSVCDLQVEALHLQWHPSAEIVFHGMPGGLQSAESMPSSMSKLAEAAEEEEVPTELVEQLQERVRELETEQRLMQQELDGITAEAQRADSHLRWRAILLCLSQLQISVIWAEKTSKTQQAAVSRWLARALAALRWGLHVTL